MDLSWFDGTFTLGVLLIVILLPFLIGSLKGKVRLPKRGGKFRSQHGRSTLPPPSFFDED